VAPGVRRRYLGEEGGVVAGPVACSTETPTPELITAMPVIAEPVSDDREASACPLDERPQLRDKRTSIILRLMAAFDPNQTRFSRGNEIN
jgi:hypothetical protein